MPTRRLGNSEIHVSSVALGCWPIAGMTSLGINSTDSQRTVLGALDQGVNFFDTAYAYGRDGESERLLGKLLRDRREQCVIATKGGLHWDQTGARVLDASPARLRWECEASLRRLGFDHVDLLYLHAPDPNCPLEESAQELRRIQQAGMTRSVGVSNVTLDQLQAFHRICPVTAVQPPYNLLMRQAENDLIPWCQSQRIAVVPYWSLMKGLLAGRLTRDHQFQPGDGRAKYPMFQGTEWQRNQDLLEALRPIAVDLDCTVAQLAVAWVIAQPGITSALCGAKRADQIEETAQAMCLRIPPAQLKQIAAALDRRGVPDSVSAV